MAVDFFLKLGAKIKGESIDKGKDGLGAPLKDQIHLLSWSWSMSQQGTTHQGKGGGAGRANIGDIAFSKYLDLSSNDINKALTNGTHFDKALLTARKAGGADPLPYYYIELEDVIISSYSIGGSSGGDDRMVDSVSLNFARYRITYTLQDEKGVKMGQTTAGWNIPENVEFGA